MEYWKTTLIPITASIHKAIKIIDDSLIKIGLITDEKKYLLGTVTDGDIRRGILKGIAFNESVKSIMNHHPIVAGKEASHQEIYTLMQRECLRYRRYMLKYNRKL